MKDTKVRNVLNMKKALIAIAKMREWVLNYKIEGDNGIVYQFVKNKSELKIIEKEAKNTR